MKKRQEKKKRTRFFPTSFLAHVEKFFIRVVQFSQSETPPLLLSNIFLARCTLYCRFVPLHLPADTLLSTIQASNRASS